MYFQMESSQMPKRSRREDWAKGMPVQPVFLAEKKGNKPSDIVEIPKGDEASQSFKTLVVKEMLKSGMTVRRNVSK